MTDKITVDRELLQKICNSLDSRCGTNAPERTEIIPVLVELLDAPVQECGYDETTGSCTRNPCCAVAPVQEPEISDAQASLLASALGECILASGIVGKDKDGFSGPELLMFAEDLKQMLERSRQPAQEPDTSCRFPLCQTAKYQQDLEMQVAKELIGEQPHKAVKLTEAEIHNADPMPHGMSDTHRIAFGKAIEAAVLKKNGLES